MNLQEICGAKDFVHASITIFGDKTPINLGSIPSLDAFGHYLVDLKKTNCPLKKISTCEMPNAQRHFSSG